MAGPVGMVDTDGTVGTVGPVGAVGATGAVEGLALGIFDLVGLETGAEVGLTALILGADNLVGARDLVGEADGSSEALG